VPVTCGRREIASLSAPCSACVYARPRHQRTRRAVLLRDQRRQHVHGFDVLIVAAGGEALGVRERFLELGG
jgi:hypothetical protein